MLESWVFCRLVDFTVKDEAVPFLVLLFRRFKDFGWVVFMGFAENRLALDTFEASDMRRTV